MAKRFIAAIAAQDYAAADKLFNDPGERFIVTSAEKYWAFRPRAELLPITIKQLLSGERRLDLHCKYFYLDENVTGHTQIAATALGLKHRSVISESRSAIIIDRDTPPARIR